MTVSAGQTIVSLDTVLLERRINRVEAGAGSIVVSEEAAVNSYPLRAGAIDRVVADERLVFGVSVSLVTGYGLISVFDPSGPLSPGGGNDDFLQLWDDQDPAELVWSIDADTDSTFRGVDQDRVGNVYAVSIGDTRGLRKYNSSQAEQWTTESWAEGEDVKNFIEPKGCALTNNKQSIWVTDLVRRRAERFAASSGAHLEGFDLDEVLGGKITIAPNGKIYITYGRPDSPADNRIVRYSSGGTFELEWGSFGDGDGQFERIIGITSSPNHNVIFVYDETDITNFPIFGRVQAFNANGSFLWSRAVGPSLSGAGIPNGTGGTAFGFGSQTEWFRYPTEFTVERVSAGTPDGGFAVPSDNFYEGNIIRPNTVSDMQAAIEAVASSYVNATYAEPFNWEPSHRSNLYTAAVDFTKDDWDKPTKEALEGVAIRPDEYSEIDLCLNVLELSFPV